MKKICHYCNKKFITDIKKRKYCSRKCHKLQYFQDNPRLYRDKKWLEQKYLKEKLSCDKIAEELGVGHTTIYKWIKRFGIKTRPQPSSGGVTGKDNPSWKGGIHENRGYIYQRALKHPRATQSGYVLQHVLEMERKLGRYLTEKETVHHKDGNKRNNRIENLQLFESQAKHRGHEELINLFAKQLIWGELKPKFKKKLKKLFREFLRKSNKL